MGRLITDLEMEVKIDLDALSYNLSRRLNTEQLCTFVKNIIEEYCDIEVDEAIFLSQLGSLIKYIEQCPEDYEGTKWEMLPAMKGLLED